MIRPYTMPPLTLPALPIVFRNPQFRYYNGKTVRVVVSYPKRARSHEFIERRFYTVPLLMSSMRGRASTINARNVLLAFSEDDATFADATATDLATRYRVDCRALLEPLDDLKHYSATARVPLIVWLDPSDTAVAHTVYYYEDR